MAAMTKNINFFKKPKLLYFSQKVPTDTILKGDHPRIISAKIG
jgi:hypothetical protein